MADKFLKIQGGQMAEQEAVTSGGVPNANKIPALGAQGRLDESMMPVGVAPEVVYAECTEALDARDLVNIYADSTGTKCRKADRSNGRRAMGFTLESYGFGESARIHLEGNITGLSARTPGAPQYLSTVGGITETPPSGAGDLLQEVGYAIGEEEVSFEPQQPITLA